MWMKNLKHNKTETPKARNIENDTYLHNVNPHKRRIRKKVQIQKKTLISKSDNAEDEDS